MWKDNQSLVDATSMSGTVVEPNGSVIALSNPIHIHRGFYIWLVNVTSNAPLGDYRMSVMAYLPNGMVSGVTSFQVEEQCPTASQSGLT